jgi:hypothetical protein
VLGGAAVLSLLATRRRRPRPVTVPGR